MEITLDMTRDYGSIHPPIDSNNGTAHYTQDGFYFDAEGNLVEGMMDDVARARLRRARAEQDANKAADVARRKALADAGEDPDAPDVSKAPDGGRDPKDADLVAWLKGEKKYPFMAITGTIKRKFGIAVQNKDAAKSVLLELNIVGPDEVRI